MRKIGFLLMLTCILAIASCSRNSDKQAADEAQAITDGKTDSMADAAEAMQNQQAVMDTLLMDTTKAAIDTIKR